MSERKYMINLGFIGFGLIGASIAKALKANKPGKYGICVYDYHKDENPSLNKAVADGCIDSLRKDFNDLFSCRAVFLCAPALKNIPYLSQLKEEAEKRKTELPLLSDVGSVKGNIVKAAEELGLGERFIGGHPMAGSEKTGYENAGEKLLENAYYILTPAAGSSENDLDFLKELVTDTGALPVVLDCDTHDRVTAAISHVPHIVAMELVNLVQDAGDDTELMKLLAAGGFKDITRIASSSPDMWQSILLSNREQILDTLDRFQDALVRIEAAMISNDGKYIYRNFDRAGDFRSRIPDNRGMLKKNYRFYVDIEDKAGAIAEIAGLLHQGGISIKNIGIIHNRDYEDGVLRVEFYSPEDEEKAALLLENNKYIVHRT